VPALHDTLFVTRPRDPVKTDATGEFAADRGGRRHANVLSEVPQKAWFRRTANRPMKRGYCNRLHADRRASRGRGIVIATVNGSLIAVPLRPHRLLMQLREHDVMTYEHCLSVGLYAQRLAIALGMPAEFAAFAREVGQLHDVGKIAIPLSLLRENKPLSYHDRQLIRDHAQVGAQMVAADPGTGALAAGVRGHHERLDGHGYPDNLRGDQIPLEARLIAVADTFDALTRGRPYRDPEPVGTVFTIMVAARQRQMEASFVDAFITMIERDGLNVLHEDAFL
jgi:HD-GYP domain-containing protein (c-di-GMP phosphodiesterase class II)